jgi:hypothetical protein
VPLATAMMGPGHRRAALPQLSLTGPAFMLRDRLLL